MQPDTAGQVSKAGGTDEKVITQLTDALNTQVTLSGPGANALPAANLPPLTSLPPQLTTANLIGQSPISANLIGQPTLNTNLIGRSPVSASLLGQPTLPPSLVGQSPISSGLLQTPSKSPPSAVQTQMGAYASPILLSNAAPSPLSMPPTSTLVGLGPPPSIGIGSSPQMSAGPPPKTGFQPVPHSLQGYESHHAPNTALPPQSAAMPAAPTGVAIFTPTYNPSTPASPYNNPVQYSAPIPQGSMHTGGGSASVDLPLDVAVQGNYQSQNSQDLSSNIREWIETIKTNETVNMVMQKAKSGAEKLITAMDPQMRDVLYSGGDINIMVASSKLVKIEPVKDAFQSVFGRATVNGRDSQPGIAPQPVGFSSGIKGAEERINNLRRSGMIEDRQVCVAVESFIVDLQNEQWYDISCLMLSDPVHNITLHTFSQATPVNIEYVQAAQSETPPDYALAWSGLSVTVGQLMHRQCAVDPSDWHYYFAGISRRDTLLLAAKQLAYIYKQRLPRN